MDNRANQRPVISETYDQLWYGALALLRDQTLYPGVARHVLGRDGLTRVNTLAIPIDNDALNELGLTDVYRDERRSIAPRFVIEDPAGIHSASWDLRIYFDIQTNDPSGDHRQIDDRFVELLPDYQTRVVGNIGSDNYGEWTGESEIGDRGQLPQRMAKAIVGSLERYAQAQLTESYSGVLDFAQAVLDRQGTDHAPVSIHEMEIEPARRTAILPLDQEALDVMSNGSIRYMSTPEAEPQMVIVKPSDAASVAYRLRIYYQGLYFGVRRHYGSPNVMDGLQRGSPYYVEFHRDGTARVVSPGESIGTDEGAMGYEDDSIEQLTRGRALAIADDLLRCSKQQITGPARLIQALLQRRHRKS